MENSSFSYVRIESAKFGNRGLLCTGLGFVVAIFVCFTIGFFGPPVLSSQSDDDPYLTDQSSLVTNRVREKLSEYLNCSTEWAWFSVNPSKLVAANQLMWTEASFIRNKGVFSEVGHTVNITVDVAGSSSGSPDSQDEDATIAASRAILKYVYFPLDSAESAPFFLFGVDSIKFNHYRTKLSLTLPSDMSCAWEDLSLVVKTIYVNEEYTKFELTWKYLFLFATLLVMFFPYKNCGFVLALRQVKSSLWSWEQKWVLSLLSSLLVFNDPFFAAQVYSKYPSEFFAVYFFFLASFMAVLLMFWVFMFDELRRDENNVNSFGTSTFLSSSKRKYYTAWFYGSKIGIVLGIWASLISVYYYLWYNKARDRAYTGHEGDLVAFDGGIALFSFLASYLVLLFYLLARNVTKISKLKTPYQFLFTTTFIVICFSIGALYAGILQPFSSSSVAFLALYSIINMYVWILAFAYTPLLSDDSDDIHFDGCDPESNLIGIKADVDQYEIPVVLR